MEQNCAFDSIEMLYLLLSSSSMLIEKDAARSSIETYKTPRKGMPAAPGIPSLSPTQVLTRPNNAWLQRSNEIWYTHCAMAAGNQYMYILLSIMDDRSAIFE